MGLASQLERAVKAAGVQVEGVSIGDPATRASWRVHPANLQAAAQATIDAFNPADPAHEQADLDGQIKWLMDNDGALSAIIWTILDTYTQTAPATIAKYNSARTKILAAFKAQPWTP